MGESQDLKMKILEDESNHFVCPDCHSHLVKSEDESANICKKCGAKFNFCDGIYDLYPQVPFAKINSINFAQPYQFLGDYPSK
jgi:ribosomal protein L37AE/L43A